MGAGQTYTTLTNAVAAYNTSCLTGPVVFLLKDAIYGGAEIFPIKINANPDANATNTLTIKPDAGVSTTITGSSTSSIIQFNGADYVTIDGSNNGSTSRNLTIINNDASTSGAVIWLNNTAALDAATNNTIKNCTITGNSPNTTFFGIFSGGSTLSYFADVANYSNTYRNNAVSAASYGISVGGPTGNESNTTIADNSLTNIGFRGIYAGNQQNISVTSNIIQGLSSTNISSFNPSAAIIVEYEMSGGNINRNTISNIKNTGGSAGSGWASYGIVLNTSSANASLTVSNNMLYDIASLANASNADNNGHGIVIEAGGGYNIFYNSVNMSTNQGAAGIAAAMYIYGGLSAASLDIRNNIFENSQTTGTSYAIYSKSGNAVFTNINNYDYWNASGVNIGFLSSNRATISAWRTATGKDLKDSKDAVEKLAAELEMKNPAMFMRRRKQTRSLAGLMLWGAIALMIIDFVSQWK